MMVILSAYRDLFSGPLARRRCWQHCAAGCSVAGHLCTSHQLLM